MTTIWLTVVGAVTVIESPVAVVVVPDPELLDPELLDPELLDVAPLDDPELLDPELLDPELLDPELLDPELLELELLEVVDAAVAMPAVEAAAGVAVSPPQPARPTDAPVMTNRSIGREQISLNVSYISNSPSKAIGPASLECHGHRIASVTPTRLALL